MIVLYSRYIVSNQENKYIYRWSMTICVLYSIGVCLFNKINIWEQNNQNHGNKVCKNIYTGILNISL